MGFSLPDMQVDPVKYLTVSNGDMQILYLKHSWVSVDISVVQSFDVCLVSLICRKKYLFLPAEEVSAIIPVSGKKRMDEYLIAGGSDDLRGVAFLHQRPAYIHRRS
jgi:hypothetical protein